MSHMICESETTLASKTLFNRFIAYLIIEDIVPSPKSLSSRKRQTIKCFTIIDRLYCPNVRFMSDFVRLLRVR